MLISVVLKIPILFINGVREAFNYLDITPILDLLVVNQIMACPVFVLLKSIMPDSLESLFSDDVWLDVAHCRCVKTWGPET